MRSLANRSLPSPGSCLRVSETSSRSAPSYSQPRGLARGEATATMNWAMALARARLASARIRSQPCISSRRPSRSRRSELYPSHRLLAYQAPVARATRVAAVQRPFQAPIKVAVKDRLVLGTGISLLFISGGGSSLITLFVALGLLESILSRHRRVDF